MTGGADDARLRAAATKRNRTTSALLSAARALFDEHGWDGTRVEDVAELACVGVATAYAHFKTKQGLAACAYAPLVEAVTNTAQDDIMQSRVAVDAVRRYVAGLADAILQHQTLAEVALLPIEGDEPRLFGRLVETLARLIQYGVQQEVFQPSQPTYQIARYHVRAMLSLAAMGEGDLTQLTLSQLLSALGGRNS